jgi:hypothetical protein
MMIRVVRKALARQSETDGADALQLVLVSLSLGYGHTSFVVLLFLPINGQISYFVCRNILFFPGCMSSLVSAPACAHDEKEHPRAEAGVLRLWTP